MQIYQDCVKHFHTTKGVSPTQPLPAQQLKDLETLGLMVHDAAASLEPRIQEDPRYLRVHLTLEETAEWITAIASGNEVLALDALADRLYVLLGDAVTFDLPLQEAFAEVHKSNMTKTRDGNDAGRIRNKGTSYVAPDMVGVLQRHRTQGIVPKTMPTGLQSLHFAFERVFKDTIDVSKLNEEQRTKVQEFIKGLQA